MSGEVDRELDRRYDGDARRLQMTLGCFSVEKWEAGINHMLTNGCFCPTCLLTFLEGDEEESIPSENSFVNFARSGHD